MEIFNKRKIEKYLEYGQTKLKTYIKEKKHYSSGHRVKYMLEKNNSDKLIIVFSGFTRIGLKARYNYGRTLKDIKVNKLFILDDFGYDQRGAYYLGHNMDFGIQECVSNLINTIQEKLEIKKSFYVGSSKGGYAALYFGLDEVDSTIVSGAPQYLLGDYLNRTDYNRKNCLKYIVGEEITVEKIDLLNNLLKNKIEQSTNQQNKIYLHYSVRDGMYMKHIQFMIDDFKKHGYSMELDEEKYTDHADVSLFFPSYLANTIKTNS